MRLSELIDKEGITSISGKTNISEMNLNYLLDKDFKTFNRVKSLGFLIILEREYEGLELGDLREEINLQFPVEKNSLDESMVLSSEEYREGSSFPYFKWLFILALLAGLTYLYKEGKFDTLLKTIKDKNDFFDDSKALENNSTTAEAKSVVIADDTVQFLSTEEESKDSQSIKDDVSERVELSTTTESTQKDTPKEEEKSLADVEKLMQSEIEATEVEEKRASVKREEVSNLKVESSRVVTSSSEEEQPAIYSDTITINPTRGMLWYGFVNLNTHKRKEFMKNVSTPFELQGGQWLLVTGHGFVDIVSDRQTVEVADSAKHYFYIDNSEIRELRKEEFRSMNGGRGW